VIHLDLAQGSGAWFKARLGIPTASCFDKILTPKTMKLSGQCDGYAHLLIAEQILGRPMNTETFDFMERGNLLEKHAVTWYELQRDCDTEAAGFFLRDDRRVGASPDFLVGANGLAEIKCPSAPVHIGYLLDKDGIGYRTQVQGQLWIAEREWNDTISFNPDLPNALVRQYRDEKFIAALAAAVDQFLSFMDECKLRLAQAGYIDAPNVPGLRIA
jgi:hypothetical protein